MAKKQQELAAVREQHKDWLMRQPGVIGTATGIDAKGRKVIKIYTNEISEQTKKAISDRLGNAPIDFNPGVIQAY